MVTNLKFSGSEVSDFVPVEDIDESYGVKTTTRHLVQIF